MAVYDVAHASKRRAPCLKTDSTLIRQGSNASVGDFAVAASWRAHGRPWQTDRRSGLFWNQSNISFGRKQVQPTANPAVLVNK